jgi:hypothetical protein
VTGKRVSPAVYLIARAPSPGFPHSLGSVPVRVDRRQVDLTNRASTPSTFDVRRGVRDEFVRPVVAILVSNREDRARIADGLHGRYRPFFCSTWNDVIAAVSHGDVRGAILTADDSAGSPAHHVQRVRAAHPLIPIVIYDPGARHRDSPLSIIAGVCGCALVGSDVDDRRILLVALHDAVTVSAVEATMAVVRRIVPSYALTFFEHCLRCGQRRLTATAIPPALGVCRKTIHNRLVSAGLPPAGWAMGWCRLAIAARHLDEGYAVERVAHDLEFPSAAALSNMLRRYAGVRPRELEMRGGFRHFLTLFEQGIAPRDSSPSACELHIA